jgi:uracil phosphoribosyltransferase
MSESAKDSTIKDDGFGDNVYVSTHPILSHKITILRSSTTKNGTFRAVLKELTYHLGYEATRHLTTEPVAISVPLPKIDKRNSDNKINGNDDDADDAHADYEGQKIKERVALIPILRSGLGMVDSMLELLPMAEVHHIGMYKSKMQDHPVLYYNRLPRKCNTDVAFVLDPCIATSSTVKSVVTMLKKVSIVLFHRNWTRLSRVICF